MTPEERIGELESKLCFTEDLVDELNRTLFRQQEQLDLLQRQVRELYRLLRDSAAGEGREGDLRAEIPPHY